jgi:hypothetical protein
MPTSATNFQISKLDDEQRLVFGYANVAVSKSTSSGSGGVEFFDLQRDSIPAAELEKAAYDFVLEFRDTGEMHEGGSVGRLVESIVFTPDKLQALATDPVTGAVYEEGLSVLKQLFPPRWWVGFKLEPASYQAVKSGKYKMFSIAGEADRTEVSGV